MSTLYIKNMVCNRCIEAVSEEFSKLNIPIQSIALGEAIVPSELSSNQMDQLSKALSIRGFELLKDNNSKLITQIKSILVDQIHHKGQMPKVNFSTLLSDKLKHDYSSLSRLFSSVEGITVEKYLLKLKIEKVKELIIYDELNLSEISYQLNYSSVAHLSSQFKKETGMTPSEFKKLEIGNRNELDKL
ncbi:helix-turn-helix domain-containing protein [Fulvivirga lutea]|uniref:Helix-turn-helix transcriptional regulator n=1 Tax=Fulvivirga lutea TaxID=2810512 RepID=A0A974WIZ5_9BACT|nr:AraC family transcriptional regulator [Fulvivirga lutea]QSE98779.1 helix-turn-helix transcriptional regulator [Fulvivirga lutea]